MNPNYNKIKFLAILALVSVVIAGPVRDKRSLSGHTVGDVQVRQEQIINPLINALRFKRQSFGNQYGSQQQRFGSGNGGFNGQNQNRFSGGGGGFGESGGGSSGGFGGSSRPSPCNTFASCGPAMPSGAFSGGPGGFKSSKSTGIGNVVANARGEGGNVASNAVSNMGGNTLANAIGGYRASAVSLSK